MRTVKFFNEGFFHVFNRGVDKRDIFLDKRDIERFLKSVELFNDAEKVGSLYVRSYISKKNRDKEESKKTDTKIVRPKQKLVEIIAYCFNPNHYHLILQQKLDEGISRFMHKLGTGYTRYFNLRHKRSGVLFQGRFKSIYIDTDSYLNHLSVYVNLNFKIHRMGNGLYRSSWQEYVYNKGNICDKEIILNQFDSPEDYRKFALFTLESIQQRKDLERLLIE